ncbi:MAG: SCO family protein [Euryarchaeota archaeon]|jgi:protein SCO1/2|nr:SCO family protein [Euryarchaeota archaeon]MBT5735600.1 SCO family protein [Euryarchaeota archaeon]
MNRSIISLVMALIIILPGCMTTDTEQENPFHGDFIDSRDVNDFDLITSDNQSYNFQQETENKVVIIAFLFTNCYDICPIVTYNLGMIHDTLTQSQKESIEFLTITVDPWRDNITTLSEWKLATQSNWTHLTINNLDSDSEEMQELNGIWNNFDVGLLIEENETTGTSGRHHPGDYNVNHTTGTVIVDHLGNQRVWWGDYDWIVDLVKEDLLYLVSEIE